MDTLGNGLPPHGRLDLSVVVSTFNRRASLRRTLDSLLAQRVPVDFRYEIIIVDNGCTDGTRDLVAAYIRRHPMMVRYAVEPRAGVSYGRNAGVRLSRADVVAFTDDDNVVARTWVAEIVDLLRTHPEMAGVGGKVLPEWPAPPPLWLNRLHWSPLAILDYGERPFPTSAQRPMCLLTANLALRRRVLEAVGGFSPEFPRCQDHELLLRIWGAGDRVLYAPSLVAFAPVEPERMTRRYHRRWHASHGHYAAAMQLEEAIDTDGRLYDVPPETVRFLGSPGYVYADLARHAGRWLRAASRRETARAAHYEHRLRYLVAYIVRAARLTRGYRPNLVRNAGQFALAHTGRRARSVNMSVARLAGAHLLVALLLGGSAWDIATGQEHWPISPYPMFSQVERSFTLDSLLLTGVDDADGSELPLRDFSQIGPFDQCRLITAFQRVRNRRDDGATLRAMLKDCLLRYERQRERGAHDGPRLRAIRVYAAHWTLDPQARNVEQPDSTRLLGEVAATEL